MSVLTFSPLAETMATAKPDGDIHDALYEAYEYARERANEGETEAHGVFFGFNGMVITVECRWPKEG